MSGVRDQTLVLRDVAALDSGDYSVVVSNAAGIAVGGPAAVTIVDRAVTTVAAGRSLSISSVFEGNEPRWQRSTDGGASWTDLSDDGRIAGAATATLSLGSVGADENGQLLRLVDRGSSTLRVFHAVRVGVEDPLLSFPVGVAVGFAGVVYVADAALDQILRFEPGTGLRALAGEAGRSGIQDGPAQLARFNDPSGLVLSADGTVWVADRGNALLRRIVPGGSVGRVAGEPSVRGGADGTGEGASFSAPAALAVDSAGRLYVADAMAHTIRRVDAIGRVETFAGSFGQAGDGDGEGPRARFNQPSGLALDPSGNVYVADSANHLIRRISPDGWVSTVAGVVGVGGSADGTGGGALFNRPMGLVWGRDGALYVCDSGNSTIRRVQSDGRVTTLAGVPGIAGHRDGVGLAAWFSQPQAIATDSSGRLYVADTGNAALRTIEPDGSVSTVRLSAASPTEAVGSTSQAGASPAPPASASSSGGSSGGSGGGSAGVFMGGFVLCLVVIYRGAVGNLRRKRFPV